MISNREATFSKAVHVPFASLAPKNVDIRTAFVAYPPKTVQREIRNLNDRERE